MSTTNKIGTPVGVSEWFNDEPKIARKEVRTFIERWMCPQENCEGEMRDAGFSWSTNPPGYHHTCNKCGYTAAMSGKRYPRTIHEEL